jgi:enamine deaminase RidA (YjgF/YER057c/UK114 family)
MAEIEARLKRAGLYLPEPLKVPAGLKLPFKPVVVRGTTVYIAGHAPQEPDGSISQPFGKVGADLTAEQGYEMAKKVGLSMLGDLKRALGDLDRISGWCHALGMVNVAPGFSSTTPVINGFSELILDLFGPEKGAHSRSAVGVAVLPLNISVEIEAVLQIAG